MTTQKGTFAAKVNVKEDSKTTKGQVVAWKSDPWVALADSGSLRMREEVLALALGHAKRLRGSSGSGSCWSCALVGPPIPSLQGGVATFLTCG